MNNVECWNCVDPQSAALCQTREIIPIPMWPEIWEREVSEGSPKIPVIWEPFQIFFYLSPSSREICERLRTFPNPTGHRCKQRTSSAARST